MSKCQRLRDATTNISTRRQEFSNLRHKHCLCARNLRAGSRWWLDIWNTLSPSPVRGYRLEGKWVNTRATLSTCGVTYSSSSLPSLKMYLSTHAFEWYTRCVHMSRDSEHPHPTTSNMCWMADMVVATNGRMALLQQQQPYSVYTEPQRAANRLNLCEKQAMADAYFVCGNVFCVNYRYIYESRVLREREM